MLTSAELHTLTHGWTARMGEANEYNRYVEIARLEGSLRLDAQAFAYRAELSAVRNQRLLAYCLADKKLIQRQNDVEMVEDITEEEAIRFATAHTYLDYRDTLHFFTFENLPLEVRQDLALLDDSVGFSRRYLEDEVTLYEMMEGGNISAKNKETLAETILSRLYYDGIRKMRNGTERDGFMIGDHYAELPLAEVMHKVAHDAGIAWKNKGEEKLLDDIEAYAKKKDATMVSLAKESLHSWLDDGLFTRDFAPIFASDRHDTWNGDTKSSHAELFTLWYAELEKSKEYFAGLFSAQKLKRQEMEMTLLFEAKVVEIITGESLYTCREELEFVRQYKKQVELMLPFSNFACFIEKHAKPSSNYATLCELKKLGKRAADVFDADFAEEYEKFIESYRDEITLLNHELRKLTDMATEHIHTNTDEESRYEIQITDGKFWFDLEEKGEPADIARKYAEEFEKAMKPRWGP